jgi:hypothetical protein
VNLRLDPVRIKVSDYTKENSELSCFVVNHTFNPALQNIAYHNGPAELTFGNEQFLDVEKGFFKKRFKWCCSWNAGATRPTYTENDSVPLTERLIFRTCSSCRML